MAHCQVVEAEVLAEALLSQVRQLEVAAVEDVVTGGRDLVSEEQDNELVVMYQSVILRQRILLGQALQRCKTPLGPIRARRVNDLVHERRSQTSRIRTCNKNFYFQYFLPMALNYSFVPTFLLPVDVTLAGFFTASAGGGLMAAGFKKVAEWVEIKQDVPMIKILIVATAIAMATILSVLRLLDLTPLATICVASYVTGWGIGTIASIILSMRKCAQDRRNVSLEILFQFFLIVDAKTILNRFNDMASETGTHFDTGVQDMSQLIVMNKNFDLNKRMEYMKKLVQVVMLQEQEDHHSVRSAMDDDLSHKQKDL